MGAGIKDGGASKKEIRRMIFEKEETCCEETKRVEGEMSEQWGQLLLALRSVAEKCKQIWKTAEAENLRGLGAGQKILQRGLHIG